MMKKIVLVLVSLFVFTLVAQEKGIGVNASIYFMPKIKEYTAHIILPLDVGGYNNTGMKRYATLEDMKKDFLKIMNKKGVDSSKFKENPLSILSSFGGTKINQLSLILKTPNKQDILNLMDTGVYIRIYNIYANVELTKKDYAELTKKCLEEAKSSALIIAKQSKLKLGKIESINVDSSNLEDKMMVTLGIDEKQKFGMYVKFSTE